MKILHIGGYNFVTMSLVDAQRKLGARVSVLGPTSRESALILQPIADELTNNLDKILEEKFDVIFFHLQQSLLGGSDLTTKLCRPISPALIALREKGVKLIYFSYDYDKLLIDSETSSKLLNSNSPCDFFTHFYLGAPLIQEPPKTLASWSYLPIPVDLGMIQPKPAKEPGAQEVRILHISKDLRSTESEKIVEAVAALRQKNFRFHFEAIPYHEISDPAALHATLLKADLFIEGLNPNSYGLLAVYAMASGCPVLSGNSELSKKSWEILNFSPVVTVTAENLVARLESIIREPKCLRDLSKRSRAFAEKYHNSEIIAARTLEVLKAQ